MKLSKAIVLMIFLFSACREQVAEEQTCDQVLAAVVEATSEEIRQCREERTSALDQVAGLEQENRELDVKIVGPEEKNEELETKNIELQADLGLKELKLVGLEEENEQLKVTVKRVTKERDNSYRALGRVREGIKESVPGFEDRHWLALKRGGRGRYKQDYVAALDKLGAIKVRTEQRFEIQRLSNEVIALRDQLASSQGELDNTRTRCAETRKQVVECAGLVKRTLERWESRGDVRPSEEPSQEREYERIRHDLRSMRERLAGEMN